MSYDRPGYGGSTRHLGRGLASAADDRTRVADALDIDRFAMLGHSGGASHALACAALLPRRVLAVVAASALAPFNADDLEWFDGIQASGEAALRAAADGLASKERYEASARSLRDPTQRPLTHGRRYP